MCVDNVHICMYSTACVYLCMAWSTCVYTHGLVCVCVCVVCLFLCGCMVHAQEYEAGALLDCSHITLRQVSHYIGMVTILPRLYCQRTLRIRLCLHCLPQHWGCRHTQPGRAFHVDAEDLNSGPIACKYCATSLGLTVVLKGL